MPLNDLELATLSWSCYFDIATFDRVIALDGDWAGIKHYPDNEHVIAFRGSTTVEDWLRDFQGLMVEDPELGGVETGFMKGIRDVLAYAGDEIEAVPAPKIYITGHSLGAARALLFAALVCAQGHAQVIQRVTVFGSPRPGGMKVLKLLNNVPINSYKNGDDPVCDVPIEIPLLEPYTHPRQLIVVDVPPSEDDSWGPIARHHSELYVAAMRKLYGQSNSGV